jgi:hypothetical protein
MSCRAEGTGFGAMFSRESTSGLRRHVLAIGVALCSAFGCAGLSSAPALAALPDGRVYEVVSPAASERNANVYVPGAGFNFLSVQGEHGIETHRPFEVAPSGDAVAYAGDPPPTGGGSSGLGNGTEYVARRSPGGGWNAVDVEPPTVPVAEYQAFSDDLSVGILRSEVALSATAPPAPYLDLYAHASAAGGAGEYTPFFTGSPPNRSGGEFESGVIYAGTNAGANGVPGLSHLLFEANDVLLAGEGALETELNEAVRANIKEGEPRRRILYDRVGGRLSVVNVLPNGKTDANASFGSFTTQPQEEAPGLSHVISADGSRIFWTDGNTGNLYVRENAGSPDAATVQVDAAVGGGGFFWTASADGSKVLFTKGDLYQYSVTTGQTTDLTPGVGVQGVVGASEDGSYVYLVAGGVLTVNENGAKEKATLGSCEAAEEGKEREEEELGHVPLGRACNLYLLHIGEPPRFITTFPARENSDVRPYNGAENDVSGDWQAAPGYRTAQVTPDGHSLVFMSRARLTEYDNEYKGLPLQEVFLYEDAGTGVLRCVSCNPTGEPPVATEFDTYRQRPTPLGAFIPITHVPQARSLPRVITDDGSRVFFDSAEPLTPQATNGWLGVYEWERSGMGSCRQNGGCTYLLSGGTDPESSYLLGADRSGENVFIVTRAKLVPQDRNGNDDVYDARVGGVQPSSPAACSGSDCQGIPPAPPIFATLPSVTFNGVGNFPPPVLSTGPRTKPLTNAQKLAKALNACKAKHNKHKRAACEAQARKRYGAAKSRKSASANRRAKR